MFGQIGIQRSAALNAGGIVLDHLLECLKPAVMHVRRGELDISQSGHPKFSFIARLMRCLESPGVFRLGIQAIVLAADSSNEKTKEQIKALNELLVKVHQEDKDKVTVLK